MIRAAAALALSLATLAGCTGGGAEDGRDGKDPDDIGKRLVEPTSVGDALSYYCEVQGLRALVVAGQVEESRLPAFADRTIVDGSPRIVDFTQRPTDGGFARVLDRLFASPGLRAVEVPEGTVRRCMDETTDADIERTQGAPGFADGLDD